MVLDLNDMDEGMRATGADVGLFYTKIMQPTSHLKNGILSATPDLFTVMQCTYGPLGALLNDRELF